jgi:hypothetical protein
MKRIPNPFVYCEVDENALSNPTIPAWLHRSYAQNYEAWSYSTDDRLHA